MAHPVPVDGERDVPGVLHLRGGLVRRRAERVAGHLAARPGLRLPGPLGPDRIVPVACGGRGERFCPGPVDERLRARPGRGGPVRLGPGPVSAARAQSRSPAGRRPGRRLDVGPGPAVAATLPALDERSHPPERRLHAMVRPARDADQPGAQPPRRSVHPGRRRRLPPRCGPRGLSHLDGPVRSHHLRRLRCHPSVVGPARSLRGTRGAECRGDRLLRRRRAPPLVSVGGGRPAPHPPAGHPSPARRRRRRRRRLRDAASHPAPRDDCLGWHVCHWLAHPRDRLGRRLVGGRPALGRGDPHRRPGRHPAPRHLPAAVGVPRPGRRGPTYQSASPGCSPARSPTPPRR